jgi:hypothetical protein
LARGLRGRCLEWRPATATCVAAADVANTIGALTGLGGTRKLKCRAREIRRSKFNRAVKIVRKSAEGFWTRNGFCQSV